MDIVIAAGVFVAIALIYPCYVAHRRMKAEWEANRVVQPAMTEQAIRMQQKGAARLDALEGGHHQGAAGPPPPNCCQRWCCCCCPGPCYRLCGKKQHVRHHLHVKHHDDQDGGAPPRKQRHSCTGEHTGEHVASPHAEPHSKQGHKKKGHGGRRHSAAGDEEQHFDQARLDPAHYAGEGGFAGKSSNDGFRGQASQHAMTAGYGASSTGRHDNPDLLVSVDPEQNATRHGHGGGGGGGVYFPPTDGATVAAAMGVECAGVHGGHRRDRADGAAPSKHPEGHHGHGKGKRHSTAADIGTPFSAAPTRQHIGGRRVSLGAPAPVAHGARHGAERGHHAHHKDTEEAAEARQAAADKVHQLMYNN
jgi:hypothetical protein